MQSLDRYSRVLVRHRILVGVLLAAGAITVAFAGAPLLSQISQHARHDFFRVTAGASAAATVLAMAAVIYLIALDPKIQIVKELQYGEAMELLIRNLFTTAFLFIVTTLFAIAAGNHPTTHTFENVFAWLLLTAVCAFAICSFYFALVLYKLAAHGPGEGLLSFKACVRTAYTR